MLTQTALLVIGAGAVIWLFFFKEQQSWFYKMIGSLMFMTLGFMILLPTGTNTDLDIGIGLLVGLMGFLNFVNSFISAPLFQKRA